MEGWGVSLGARVGMCSGCKGRPGMGVEQMARRPWVCSFMVREQLVCTPSSFTFSGCPLSAQLMLPHGIGGKKAASHSRPVLPPIFTWVPCLPRCGHQDPHRLCGVGGRPWHAACEYQLLCIMGPGLAGEGGLVEAYTKIWRHHSQHTPHAALRIWRGGNSPQDRDVSWWEKGCLTPG